MLSVPLLILVQLLKQDQFGERQLSDLFLLWFAKTNIQIRFLLGQFMRKMAVLGDSGDRALAVVKMQVKFAIGLEGSAALQLRENWNAQVCRARQRLHISYF